jgi:hypothetical protein
MKNFVTYLRLPQLRLHGLVLLQDLLLKLIAFPRSVSFAF